MVVTWKSRSMLKLGLKCVNIMLETTKRQITPTSQGRIILLNSSTKCDSEGLHHLYVEIMSLFGIYWIIMDVYCTCVHCAGENISFFHWTLLTPAGQRRILHLVEAHLVGWYKRFSVEWQYILTPAPTFILFYAKLSLVRFHLVGLDFKCIYLFQSR